MHCASQNGLAGQVAKTPKAATPGNIAPGLQPVEEARAASLGQSESDLVGEGERQEASSRASARVAWSFKQAH